MSVSAMSSCWGPSFPVEAESVSPSTVRIVALAIADSVNDAHGNEFYGSQSFLATKVGVSDETVRLVMRHLLDAGVLQIIRKRAGNTTIYRWMWGRTDLPGPSGPPGPSGRYLPGQSGRGYQDVLALSQENPNRNPRKHRGRWPGPSTISTSKEPKMWVNIGGDPDKSDDPNRGIKRKPTTVVIERLSAGWPAVVVQYPKYRTYKVVDHGAFATYLNNTFFGPKAKTPLSVEQVLSVVDRFMKDLERGQFMLKPSQPVWKAFTARWHNYPIEEASTAELEALRATWHRLPPDS